MYLASVASKMRNMELYLAGEHSIANWEDLNILESFYYARTNKNIPSLIGNVRNFLLDSGAFTFKTNADIRSSFLNQIDND